MTFQRFLPLFFAGLGTVALFRLVLPPAHVEKAPPLSSKDCQACHPAVWEEWNASHHAFAFQNPEVRKLSQNFLNEECLACHAPRPVLQFKPGERVLARQSDRSLGVDCLTCHARPEGGVASASKNPRQDAACAPTTDLRLTAVETCGSCHNQHGTVEQWRAAPPKLQKENCLSCHMKDSFREGGRRGRNHSFPAAHNLVSLQEAVTLEASYLKGQVHLQLTNHGAGHNFPTDERSRAADLQWRGLQNQTWGAWQHVYRFRDPYRDETDLNNTQLPAGKTWETTLHSLMPPDAVEVRLLYRTNPFQPDEEASILQSIHLLPGEGQTSDSKDLAPPPSVYAPPITDNPHLTANAATAWPENFGRPLPTLSEQELQEILDWKELWEIGLADGNDRPSSPGGRARRNLQTLPSAKRMAAILYWIEELTVPVDLKRWAYAWWAEQPYGAGVPRMILRLKYEKEEENVFHLAIGLLKTGNAAGIPGLLQVLTPARAEKLRGLFRDLPPQVSVKEKLLELHGPWKIERKLPGFPLPSLEAPEYQAEVWAMRTRFHSQPLRPVDDARFVLTRSTPDAFPMILPGKEATSLYVAEHCLQTIAWIGQPFGLWLQTLESEKRAQTLRDFLGNPLTLTRGLEAIGAIGLPEGENMLLPWLIRENREEQTAAADALLRCSPLPLQEKTKTVIQKIMGNQALSDEALFSLSLLLDANSAPPIELDSAEVERRRRWFKRRWRTPTLKSD